MIRFRTEIETILSGQPLDCSDSILILGSCFAEHIGGWLRDNYLDATCNPFGVLYNPGSIASSLTDLLDGRRYDADRDAAAGTLCYHQPTGRYYSFCHHGSLSAESSEALAQLLNDTAERAEQALQRSRHLLITFGTAWVYTLAADGRIVANCHKFPASMFSRRRLTIEEVTALWSTLLDRLFAAKPDLHVVFTVSPIRYVKETLHGNQLSKSILHLAIDELVQRYPQRVEYLPVYELLIDDLRDYRYYATDLVHPSDLAVEVVRDYVRRTLLTPRCNAYLDEVAPVLKALHHRPFHPEADVYKQFIAQNTLKIEQLIKKYHIFTLTELLQQFQAKLQ